MKYLSKDVHTCNYYWCVFLFDTDLKRTLAVLLENILERLGNVEQKVEIIYTNGSQIFRNFTGFADQKHFVRNEADDRQDGIYTKKRKKEKQKEPSQEEEEDDKDDRPVLAKGITVILLLILFS